MNRIFVLFSLEKFLESLLLIRSVSFFLFFFRTLQCHSPLHSKYNNQRLKSNNTASLGRLLREESKGHKYTQNENASVTFSTVTRPLTTSNICVPSLVAKRMHKHTKQHSVPRILKRTTKQTSRNKRTQQRRGLCSRLPLKKSLTFIPTHARENVRQDLYLHFMAYSNEVNTARFKTVSKNIGNQAKAKTAKVYSWIF